MHRDHDWSARLRAEMEAIPTPDLTASVMAEVVGRPRVSWSERLAFLWRPVPVRVSPALAGAFALLLVAGLRSFGGPPVVVDASPAAQVEEAQTMVLVHFRFEAPGATTVALAGSFNDWDASLALHESLPGVWTLVVPLDVGVHDYLFVVDGERWMPDPYAPRVDDSFGGSNSRLALPLVGNAS
jgi:hypothetical protein